MTPDIESNSKPFHFPCIWTMRGMIADTTLSVRRGRRHRHSCLCLDPRESPGDYRLREWTDGKAVLSHRSSKRYCVSSSTSVERHGFGVRRISGALDGGG